LTGDAALRQAARDHGVEVHGTLWIVEQLVRAGILSAVRARTAFDAMREAGSRLPWPLVDELLASLEDSSSSDHPT
jgi:predicted nucleic acid-binding protein